MLLLLCVHLPAHNGKALYILMGVIANLTQNAALILVLQLSVFPIVLLVDQLLLHYNAHVLRILNALQAIV